MFLEGKPFYYLYDVDALTLKYGRIGGPQGLPVQGKYGVQTSGSSTTVTAPVGTPFDPVDVGDIIVFLTGNPPEDAKTIRKVATKTSGSEITVDSAVTLAAGTPWFFYPFDLGTAAGDGWHNVSHWSAITVYIRVETLNSSGIDVSIEGGGGPFSGPVVLETPATIAAAGTLAVNVDNVTPSLRVGLQVDSSVVAGDEVTVWATGEMLQAR